MIRFEYSRQAHDTHEEIQNLNDTLQLYIDNFYYNIEDINNSNEDATLTDVKYENSCRSFKTKVLSKIDLLNDVAIDYFTSCKEDFENYDTTTRFQLPNNLEELLRNYFDTINADISASDLSKVTNEVIIKYIQMNSIYENIMDSINDLNMFNDYYEKRFYHTDNIVTMIDFIINGFYDCIDNLKMLCMSEKNFLSIVQCYILNLKIVLYIIEFIESIKYIG